VIQRRLRDAAEEIRKYGEYDYTIINRDRVAAADVLNSIVRAERVRRTRIEEQIRPILETFLTVKR
jgi:guanylate kinase